MGDTIGQFTYSITQMGKEDKSMPFNPWVNICLRHWASAEEVPCAPLVSAQLMTVEEVEWHIQALKNDLDAVGKKAKKALKEAQARTVEMVKEKK